MVSKLTDSDSDSKPNGYIALCIDLTCSCDLNCSVRGRVSSSRSRFWTLPNLNSEVSAYLDTSEP